MASKYVKVQVLSVLDTLMSTTYWLVAILVLANVLPGSVVAVVLAFAIASLLRPIAEPPTNYGVRFLLRMYMGLGKKGVTKFGKLYWSSTILNILLACVVGTAFIASWGATHESVFLWASILAFSSMASLSAQMPALILDDSAYFRIVLLSNFARYVMLYFMWRSSVSPQPCFESFFFGSLLALALGAGYAIWKGIGPKVLDISEIKDAVRLGMPAWLENAGVTLAKWGAVAAVAGVAQLGLVNSFSIFYVFTALLAGSIIAALLSGWVNVVLLASKDQHLLPAKVVGLASGMAFPFAVYFTLITVRATGDIGMALLAGALLISLPMDLLRSMLSSRAYAAMIPSRIKVLSMYALAQFLAPLTTYGVYMGLALTLSRTLASITLPYLAVRLLSLMLAKSVSRVFLNETILIAVAIFPLLVSVGITLLPLQVFSNVFYVVIFSIILTSLNYKLTSILGGHLR